ncbi:MAG: hypothetical protein ABFS46_17640 [Myxococcota bacterium]
MIGADVLLTIAEVSVAFAGFASVVVLFQHRDPVKWSPRVVVRLRTMIESSLCALLLALLPFALHHLGLSGEQLWGWSSGLAAGALVLLSSAVVRRSLRFIRSRELSRPFAFATFGVNVLVFGALVLNAAGVLFQREFGPYLLGVIWALAFASLMFLRVVVFPDAGAARRDE